VRSALFQIAETLVDLVQSDYRVRKQIRDSLENNYIRNRTQPFVVYIAFQIAFVIRLDSGLSRMTIKVLSSLKKATNNCMI